MGTTIITTTTTHMIIIMTMATTTITPSIRMRNTRTDPKARGRSDHFPPAAAL